MRPTPNAAHEEQQGRDDVHEGKRGERAGPEQRPQLAADYPPECETRQQGQLEVTHRARPERVITRRRIREVREECRNAGGGSEPFQGTAHHENARFVGDAKEKRGERREHGTARRSRAVIDSPPLCC